MKFLRPLLIAAAFAGPDPLIASDSKLVPMRTSLSTRLIELSEAGDGAGLGVAIIDGGQVALIEAKGVAQIGTATPFTTQSSMPVGSASRLFLGLVAERLHAANKLDWKKPAAQILPMRFSSRLPSSEIRPILLEDFLSYSTGITRGTLNGLFSEKQLVSFQLPEPLLLVRAAGGFSESSFYSDEIFARVLQAAGGKSYAELLQAEVINPLTLTGTYLGNKSSEVSEHHDGKRTPIQYTRFEAALSARSSLRDVAQVLANLQGGEYLNAAARAHISKGRARQLEYDFSEPGTGQGSIFAYGESDRAAVGLVGYLDSRFDGHTVSIRYVPQHNLAVVLMANYSTDDSDLSDFMRELVDQALLLKANIPKREKNAMRKPKVNLPLPRGFLAAPVEAAYATPAGVLLPQADEDSFDFELAGFNLRAIKRADGWYQLRYRLLGFIPLNFSFIENILIAPVTHQRASGEKQKLLLYAAGSEIGLFGSAVTKISGNATSNAVQQQWIGNYAIQNADRLSDAAKVSDIEIRVDDGLLVLSATFDRFVNVEFAMPLEIYSASDAKLAGIGPGLGEPLLRDRTGTLDFAGYKLVRR
jgi:CubicO group peptidase (beta-lactamase class C family)